MPEYKSKKEVESKLKQARIKGAAARKRWMQDKDPKDKEEMDKCLKECIDLQFVLDRYF